MSAENMLVITTQGVQIIEDSAELVLQPIAVGTTGNGVTVGTSLPLGTPGGGFGTGLVTFTSDENVTAALDALNVAIHAASYVTPSSLSSTLSGYATTSALTTEANTRASADTALSGRVTALEVAGYQTAGEVSSAISSALTSYVTTSALSTALSSYSTTSQMNTAISSAISAYNPTFTQVKAALATANSAVSFNGENIAGIASATVNQAHLANGSIITDVGDGTFLLTKSDGSAGTRIVLDNADSMTFLKGDGSAGQNVNTNSFTLGDGAFVITGGFGGATGVNMFWSGDPTHLIYFDLQDSLRLTMRSQDGNRLPVGIGEPLLQTDAATKGYVDIGSGWTIITANYTIVAADKGKVFLCNGTSTPTLTLDNGLPDAFEFQVVALNVNAWIVVAPSGDAFQLPGSFGATVTAGSGAGTSWRFRVARSPGIYNLWLPMSSSGTATAS